MQNISSGQIFPEDPNLHSDLGLEDSDPKLSHNTLAHDDAGLRFTLGKLLACWADDKAK